MYRLTVQRFTVGLALAAGAARAQAPAAAFEVAAIRAAPPITTELIQQIQSGKAKVGMSVEGNRVDIGFVSLADLTGMAYNVKPYQMQGPGWMSQQRFNIQAKIPDGVSKDQVPDMLRALLADRFKMTAHREKKDLPVYALIIGKNGMKLTAAEPDKTLDGGAGRLPFKVVQNGPNGAEVRSGTTHVIGGPEGIHLEIGGIATPALADMLSNYVDRPVIDMTGLTGEYQMVLDLSLEDAMRATERLLAQTGAQLPMRQLPAVDTGEASTPGGGAVFTSIDKLGLKLDARTGHVEVIVIDHMEMSPTEN